jgi:hypothetical protein
MAGPVAEVLIGSACAAQTMHLVDGAGHRLGRVFDLRCDWRPGATEIDEIIYGRTGLLERVGLRERRPASVRWSALRRIDGRAIVVDQPGGS